MFMGECNRYMSTVAWYSPAALRLTSHLAQQVAVVRSCYLKKEGIIK